jgi:hypothetical protein
MGFLEHLDRTTYEYCIAVEALSESVVRPKKMRAGLDCVDYR